PRPPSLAPRNAVAYATLRENPALEPLFWMAAALLVIGLLQGDSPRRWLAVGLVLGLGLLNKDSTAVFGLGRGAGLLLAPERRLLRTRWPWLGLAVALVVFFPNLAWQAAH